MTPAKRIAPHLRGPEGREAAPALPWGRGLTSGGPAPD